MFEVFVIFFKLIFDLFGLGGVLIEIFDVFDLLLVPRIAAIHAGSEGISVLVAAHDGSTELLYHLGSPHLLEVVEILRF